MQIGDADLVRGHCYVGGDWVEADEKAVLDAAVLPIA